MDATRITVKCVPNASRDEIAGWLGDDLKVRVRQPPEKGRANKAVCRLVASHLGLSTDAVTLLAGLHAPRKTLEIRGLATEDVKALLARDSDDPQPC